MLLRRLNSELSQYDGNIHAHVLYEDYMKRISHQDIYKCDCDAEVPYEEWNQEYKMCRDCYMEMMADHGHKYGAI